LHTVLLALNALWMSPTLDEPAHLVAGISHWRFCDFSLHRVNPPLGVARKLTTESVLI